MTNRHALMLLELLAMLAALAASVLGVRWFRRGRNWSSQRSIVILLACVLAAVVAAELAFQFE